MPIVTVDGIEVEVPQGATVMQACELAGREIPRFCYHERLSIAGNCRMCLVELEKSPKPVASCAMPAADGMVVHTASDKTRRAREGVMEFLLINHPLDCPICDQGGECDLQDQALAYGRGYSRFGENKRAVAEKYLGPFIKTAMTRCIHCTRCVRFAEEVAGVEELGALYRGEQMEITSYLERAMTSEMSGNVIDLCPVGALTAKPYAFHARPWELSRTPSIDAMDAEGANITVHARTGWVVRVTPRAHDEVNEEWISDRTRFAVDGLKERRLDRPWVRVDGRLVEASWGQAFEAVSRAIDGLDGRPAAALAGPMAGLEELVALRDLMTGLGSSLVESRLDGFASGDPGAPRAHWLLNPGLAGVAEADAVLLVGADLRADAPLLATRLRAAARHGGARVFAVGPRPDLAHPVDWLGDDLGLLADLPDAALGALAGAARPLVLVSRRNATAGVLGALSGLELVRDGWSGFGVVHQGAAHVGALEVGFATAGGLEAVRDAAPGLVVLLGVDDAELGWAGAATRIYVGTHGDAGARTADIVLPGAAYTEKSATWVNLEGRVQRGLSALFPPGDAREDWTILRALADVLGVRLPYDDLAALRRRIAAEWPHLGREGRTPAAWSPLPAGAAAPSGPAARRSVPFYLANPVCRASPTMQAAMREIVGGHPPLMLQAAQ